MKLLLAISDEKVRKFIFKENDIKNVAKLGEYDWLERDEDLEGIIGKYDAIITTWDSPKLTKEILQKANNLKIMGHCAGTVVPYIDPYIFEKGIKVVNSNIALAYSTAELAFTHVLAGVWKLKKFENNIKAGEWSDPKIEPANGLYGATVGIVGVGVIAKILLKFLVPFKCNILICSNDLTQTEVEELGGKLVSLEELCKNSDVITIHHTLNSKTQKMFGKKEFDLMKEGSVFVNTARGPIVDTNALIEAVKIKKIYAGIDVFDNEPKSEDARFLCEYENVITTPHIGGFSKKWLSQMPTIVLNDFENFKNGRSLENEIILELFLRQSPK